MFFSNSHKCLVITLKKGHGHFLLHPSKFIISSFCTHAKNNLYHPKQTGGAECSTNTLISIFSQFKSVIFSDITQLYLNTIHYASLVTMTLGTTSLQHIWLCVANTNGPYPLRSRTSFRPCFCFQSHVASGLHVEQTQFLSHMEGMQNAQCEIHCRFFSFLVIANNWYGWIFFWRLSSCCNGTWYVWTFQIFPSHMALTPNPKALPHFSYDCLL